jgi:hypothetical protein
MIENRPLRYGDLVRNDQGMHGILMSQPDEKRQLVTVAWGNGLEERLVQVSTLKGVELHQDGRASFINFREWVVRNGTPVERALDAFAGTPGLSDIPQFHGATLALFMLLASMVAAIPEVAFNESLTRAEYLDSIAQLLKGKRERQNGQKEGDPEGS